MMLEIIIIIVKIVIFLKKLVFGGKIEIEILSFKLTPKRSVVSWPLFVTSGRRRGRRGVFPR